MSRTPHRPTGQPSLAEGNAELKLDEPSMLVVTKSRNVAVAGFPVRRALPQRGRRTVGAWCFADHLGPIESFDHPGLDVGPHPHMGLQTVTWLLQGEVLHHDSLGSEQLIRPGQLNLMTAGSGIAHAEESTGHNGARLHGIQLWIAQPDATRGRASAFEHFGELPRHELDGATATVLVGTFESARSSARHDTELVGVELTIRRRTTVPLVKDFEYALVVLEGGLRIDGTALSPGQLGYLRTGRDEMVVEVTGQMRAMLLGGVPFEEEILMWWNFVARSRDEIDAADRSWEFDDGRFGSVASSLARISTRRPPWQHPGPK